jgi:A/G-specific adenine glycosylase
LIIPQSRRTIEGAEHAVHWLENHANVLPELRRILRQYYAYSGRDLPWRKTKDPYKILVAESLLQKTAAGPAQKVWGNVIQSYPTVESMALASAQDLEKVIATLGLKKRAGFLTEAARVIVTQTNGKLKGDADLLESLPGVGEYTTSAILSFAFNMKAAVIDVNAARVYSRIGGFSPLTIRQGLAFARVIGNRLVTHKSHKEVNYGVLDLAAQICRPRPFCDSCPAIKLCEYFDYHARHSGMEA